jgi:hypothetical protein
MDFLGNTELLSMPKMAFLASGTKLVIEGTGTHTPGASMTITFAELLSLSHLTGLS